MGVDECVGERSLHIYFLWGAEKILNKLIIGMALALTKNGHESMYFTSIHQCNISPLWQSKLVKLFGELFGTHRHKISLRNESIL